MSSSCEDHSVFHDTSLTPTDRLHSANAKRATRAPDHAATKEPDAAAPDAAAPDAAAPDATAPDATAPDAAAPDAAALA